MRWLLDRLPRFMLAAQSTRPQVMIGATTTFNPVTATLHLHLVWVHVVAVLTTLRPGEFYCDNCRDVHSLLDMAEEGVEEDVRPV